MKRPCYNHASNDDLVNAKRKADQVTDDGTDIVVNIMKPSARITRRGFNQCEQATAAATGDASMSLRIKLGIRCLSTDMLYEPDYRHNFNQRLTLRIATYITAPRMLDYTG